MSDDVHEQPDLDPSVLDRLADDVGDLATVTAVADIYLEQLPGRLEEMRATLTSDPSACRRVAHSLKSASATLGLLAMAETCRLLELAVESDPARAATLLGRAEQAGATADRRLREWRSRV